MAKSKYTVTVTESYPPYAPNAVLIVEAESEDQARRKAYNWILDGFAFFVEEGEVKEGDLEEDVPIFHVR